jgi:hypothetical protein
MNFTKTITLIAAAGALALPAAAQADTLVHSVTGATNLASGGGWLAWSAPAPDGGFQLQLRAPDGTVSVPAVGKFSAAPSPAIGSDQFGADGRKLNVLYERDGDIYAYDLNAKTEAKVKGASAPGVRESQPGISFGRVVFVKSGGVYSLSKGKATRIAKAKPAQLAYNGSRIAYPTASRLVLHRVSSRGADSFARASSVKDVVLTRYSLTYLTSGGKVFQTNRFGGSGDVHEIQGVKKGSATLSPTANSIAFQGSFLRWYLDDAGLQKVSTQNLFR